jgi:hypothetical protein
MASRLITIGTDGNVDYVQTPDGQRFMLGPVSVLKLVTGLVPARTAKTALEEFTEKKQVMLSVDLDKMWALLPFRRARYSSTSKPFMEKKDRSGSFSDLEINMETASYDTFSSNAELAEDIIAKVAATDSKINALVKEGKKFDSNRAKTDLHKIASRVSEIAQNVDLAIPWVGNDLTELSKKANEIHELFHPKSK